MNRFTFSFLFFILLATTSSGQFLTSIGIGGAGYQGDISPFSSRISFVTDNKFAINAGIGLEINKVFNIKVEYLRGKLSAYDRNSSKDARKLRNLSFETRVHELSLTSELDILELMNRNFLGNKFHPFFKFGIGVFHFNPKANFNGTWIELQPLGTEGQGMAVYPDRKKYSLYQVCIPFGIGFKYDLDDHLAISAQVTPRWTFTDYIDDVSTSYVDYETLKVANGELAADLGDRSWQIEGERVFGDGDRGNPSEKDWYFFLGFNMVYNFDLRRVKGVFNKDYRRVSCKTY